MYFAAAYAWLLAHQPTRAAASAFTMLRASAVGLEVMDAEMLGEVVTGLAAVFPEVDDREAVDIDGLLEKLIACSERPKWHSILKERKEARVLRVSFLSHARVNWLCSDRT
jgi:hypothetical protein